MKIDSKLKSKLKDYLFRKLKEEEQGKVTIQTPYALTEADLNFFYEQLPYLKQYHVENEVVENLIGGFVIIHGSKIIDASISSEINSLKNKLVTT